MASLKPSKPKQSKSLHETSDKENETEQRPNLGDRVRRLKSEENPLGCRKAASESMHATAVR